MSDLADFVRARLGEEEEAARAAIAERVRVSRDGEEPDWRFAYWPDLGAPAVVVGGERVLADVEAKRAIIDWHANWPVLVETQPEVRADSIDALHYTMSRQMAWLTEREYVAQFGSEPPTGPILRLLALPYASHPDYRQEWKP